MRSSLERMLTLRGREGVSAWLIRSPRLALSGSPAITVTVHLTRHHNNIEIVRPRGQRMQLDGLHRKNGGSRRRYRTEVARHGRRRWALLFRGGAMMPQSATRSN